MIPTKTEMTFGWSSFFLVAEHACQPRDRALRPHDDEAVAQVEVQVRIRKELHPRAVDARHVRAVVVREVQVADALAVHRRVRNEDVGRMHGRVFAREVDVGALASEKRHDGFLVLFERHAAKEVPHLDAGVGAGAHEAFRVVETAGNHEGAADHLTDHLDGFVFEVLVRGLDVEGDGGGVLLTFRRLPPAVFFRRVDLPHPPNRDRRPDDADDGQGVRARVRHRRVGPRPAENRQRFLHGTQPRCIRHRTVVDAQHVGQRNAPAESGPEPDRDRD